MQRAVTLIAFLSSLAALIVFAGGGIALFAIQVSGERATGAVLSVMAILAFAMVMALIFTKEGSFAGRQRGAGAIGAGMLGALPVATLAFAAVRFAGVPFGSPAPLVDWSILVIGIALVLGAASIVALGYRRSREGSDPGVVHMQQIRDAQRQLRSAFEADLDRPLTVDREGDARIRPV